MNGLFKSSLIISIAAVLAPLVVGVNVKVKLVVAAEPKVLVNPVVFRTKSPVLAPVNEIEAMFNVSGVPIFSNVITKGVELESKLMLPKFWLDPDVTGKPLMLTCNSCVSTLLFENAETLPGIAIDSNPKRKKNTLLNRLKINIKRQIIDKTKPVKNQSMIWSRFYLTSQ